MNTRAADHDVWRTAGLYAVLNAALAGLGVRRRFLFSVNRDNRMRTDTNSSTAGQGEDLTSLVQGCVRGETAEWDRLLALTRQQTLRLGRLKYRMGLDDAEDLAQTVQMRVTERLCQLRDSQAFPAWVRQLTHRAALDWLRQRRPVLSLDEPMSPTAEEVDPAALPAYDRIVLRVDLEKALSKLPAHFRTPIELHVLEGIPQEEVAQLLGRPRNTVASQIDRGLRRLQQTMSPALIG
jgi:RNA polymerase sigma-70 factor, ECF subfamily